MPAKKKASKPFHPAFDAEMMAEVTKQLPGVLVKEGYLVESRRQPAESTVKNTIPVTQVDENTTVKLPVFHPRESRRAMWIAVSIFTTVILGIWIFNTRNIIGDVWGKNRSTNNIVDTSKSDLRAVLDTIQKNDAILQKKLNTPAVAAVIPTTTTSTVEEALTEAFKSIKK